MKAQRAALPWPALAPTGARRRAVATRSFGCARASLEAWKPVLVRSRDPCLVMQPRQRVAVANAGAEPFVDFAGAGRAGDKEPSLSVIAHEPDGVAVASERALQCAFERSANQAIELLTERAAVDAEHQRPTPAFEPE